MTWNFLNWLCHDSKSSILKRVLVENREKEIALEMITPIGRKRLVDEEIIEEYLVPTGQPILLLGAAGSQWKRVGIYDRPSVLHGSLRTIQEM